MFQKPTRQLPIDSTQYFTWLKEKAPYLMDIWDSNKLLYSERKAELFISNASDQHAIMARFFLGVWMKSNVFEFDYDLAESILNHDNLMTVNEWFKEPFWP